MLWVSAHGAWAGLLARQHVCSARLGLTDSAVARLRIMVIPILAGVATADLPFEKEQFTWGQYLGPWFGQNQDVQKQYDVVALSEAVIKGDYK